MLDQHLSNVESTSWRWRHDVDLTLSQCWFNVVCPLGEFLVITPGYFFLISSWSLWCDLSLEVSRRDGSVEAPQDIKIITWGFRYHPFYKLELQNLTEDLPEIRYWSSADRSDDDEKSMLWSIYHIDYDLRKVLQKKNYAEARLSTFWSGENLLPPLKTIIREFRKNNTGNTGGWLQYLIFQWNEAGSLG